MRQSEKKGSSGSGATPSGSPSPSSASAELLALGFGPARRAPPAAPAADCALADEEPAAPGRRCGEGEEAVTVGTSAEPPRAAISTAGHGGAGVGMHACGQLRDALVLGKKPAPFCPPSKNAMDPVSQRTGQVAIHFSAQRPTSLLLCLPWAAQKPDEE